MLAAEFKSFRKIFYTLILSITFCKASLSWGFSVSRTQSYLEQATKKKLWEDRQWIRLGHYEEGIFSYSSPFTTGFFLDPEGATSPKKELLKTIEVLFSGSPDIKTTADLDKHLQCRYLARTQWLIEILQVSHEDIMPCEEMKSWKKQLNVKSVALIFAAADMGNTSSSFGHTFLKIINPENAQNKDLIDYGINYAANTDASEGLFYALKGLLGFYGGQFTMLPYHQKIREYINLEGRDIWEYHLNFSPEEVDFLVNHLIEMEPARAPYYFFSDNCSYQILRALEVVRVNVDVADHFKYFVIPIDTVKKITSLSDNDELKMVSSIKYKKSLKTDYLQSYTHLGLLQKKALDEAVEKFNIPADYELNPTERAEVFETAMKYYSIRAFRSEYQYEDEKYKLYLERVALGTQATTDGIEKVEPPQLSHDSSALYIGFGARNKVSFSSLKFRNALHDLEQKDFGTVAFSHNEMGSLEIRYNQLDQSAATIDSSQSSFKNLQVHRFTFLNLINLNPVTQLDTHYSWRVSAALMNEWKPDFEIGAGYSFDWNLFNRTRVGYFLTGRTFSGFDDQSEYRYLSGAGPNILFISRLTEDLGFSIDLSYLFLDRHDPFLRAKTKFNYSLRRNFDAQLQVENHYDATTEIQAQFVWNFIL